MSLTCCPRTGCCVYALKCPRTDAIRYIGITKSPESRRLSHRATHNTTPSAPVNIWQSVLRREYGLRPELEVLVSLHLNGHDACDDANRILHSPKIVAHVVEQQVIQDARRRGLLLLNIEHNDMERDEIRRLAITDFGNLTLT